MQIHGYYRATGASITKAQAEFATNVFSNEGVRNAAASAAAAGVRQGFSVRNNTLALAQFIKKMFLSATRTATGTEILILDN